MNLPPIQPDAGVTHKTADYHGPGNVARRRRPQLTPKQWGNPQTHLAYIDWANTHGSKPVTPEPRNQ